MENYGTSTQRKETQLDYVLAGFSDQLDRMQKNNYRLNSLGNKLKDDSQILSEGNKPVSPSINHPGQMSSLQSYLEKMIDINCYYENQLSKLEELI